MSVTPYSIASVFLANLTWLEQVLGLVTKSFFKRNFVVSSVQPQNVSAVKFFSTLQEPNILLDYKSDIMYMNISYLLWQLWDTTASKQLESCFPLSNDSLMLIMLIIKFSISKAVKIRINNRYWIACIFNNELFTSCMSIFAKCLGGFWCVCVVFFFCLFFKQSINLLLLGIFPNDNQPDH